jgi:Immunity protein 74
MFTAIDKRSATNGMSIVVRDKSKDLIEYVDGDHILFLGWERGATPEGKPAQVVYITQLMRWEAPHTAEVITPVERAKIAQNVREAYRALGLETYIEYR